LRSFREAYDTAWLIERHGYLGQFRDKQVHQAAAAA